MKTVLITGGTGEIGKKIAEKLLENNYRVILTARNFNRLIKVEEYLTSKGLFNIHIYKMDVSNDNEVKEVIRNIGREFPINFLINAAGNGEAVDYLSSKDNEWNDCIQSKLLGAIRVSREVSNLMINNEENGGIVIINGTFCYDPNPDFIINSTVNSALLGFVKAAGKYLGGKGIRINIVNPWIVESDSWNESAKIYSALKGNNLSIDELNSLFKQTNPLNRFTSINDIFNAILFLFSSSNSYINGTSITLDGGASIGY